MDLQMSQSTSPRGLGPLAEHLRIKNMDTGEVITLGLDDEDGLQASVNTNDAFGEKKKGFSKKFTSWAKGTFSELNDKRKGRGLLPVPHTQHLLQQPSLHSQDSGEIRGGQASTSGRPPRPVRPSVASALKRANNPATAAYATSACGVYARDGHGSSIGANGVEAQLLQPYEGSIHSGSHEVADNSSCMPSQALPVDPPNPKLNLPVKVLSGVRGHTRHLGTVRLIQEVRVHEGIVWTLRLSRDGRMLATGGQDGVIRVWSIHQPSKGLSMITESPDPGGTPHDVVATVAAASPRHAAMGPAAATASVATGTAPGGALLMPPTADPCRLPLVGTIPLRTFAGHLEDVLAVAWSRGKFLLSASIDKTVRLWHLDEPECLRSFHHPDFVTCVDFHPSKQRRFVTGCLDGVVRLWSIDGDKVVCSVTVHQDMISAITFSLDGKQVIVGTMRGKCRFYECSNDSKLDYMAQLDVKNLGGALRSGRKVTCIRPVPGAVDKYLISSNDSRLRLFSGYAQERKYKGAKNGNTQIQAALSQSGSHIVTGSDDGCVVVWETSPPAGPTGLPWPKNSAYGAFQTGEETVTAAIFAPDGCRRICPVTKGAGLSAATGASMGTPFSASAGGGTVCQQQQSALYGALFLVVGFSGRLQVYEST